MKRVKTTLLLIVLQMTAALALLVLSLINVGSWVKFAESMISVFWLSLPNAAAFVFLYLQIAESVPTEVRGQAVAVVLLFGKLTGSGAPYLEALAKKFNLHVVVGCALPSLLALPMNFFVEETLGAKKMK
jgi:hypothetical protein